MASGGGNGFQGSDERIELWKTACAQVGVEIAYKGTQAYDDVRAAYESLLDTRYPQRITQRQAMKRLGMKEKPAYGSLDYKRMTDMAKSISNEQYLARKAASAGAHQQETAGDEEATEIASPPHTTLKMKLKAGATPKTKGTASSANHSW